MHDSATETVRPRSTSSRAHDRLEHRAVAAIAVVPERRAHSALHRRHVTLGSLAGGAPRGEPHPDVAIHNHGRHRHRPFPAEPRAEPLFRVSRRQARGEERAEHGHLATDPPPREGAKPVLHEHPQRGGAERQHDHHGDRGLEHEARRAQ